MIDPTPEQIEAAAKAMSDASPGFFSEGSWRHLAREALAAAGVAPQEPAEDRVMMIAEHLAQAHTFTRADGEAIARAALKLAAPIQVDEAKLAEVIWAEQESRVLNGYVIHTRATAAATAAAVASHLRGGQQ